MDFVDEEDDHLPAVFDLLEHTLHALLELSTVFGAGNECADIQTEELASRKAGWNVGAVDLWEVNEAFAVVPMALMRELELSHEIVNVNGGACAMGHPIGASGARILVTLLHALRARGGKRGVASLCIGGGEATAVAVELV